MQYNIDLISKRFSDAKDSVANSRIGQTMVNAYEIASKYGKAASEFVAAHPYEAAATFGLAAVGMAATGAPANPLSGLVFSANAAALVAGGSYGYKETKKVISKKRDRNEMEDNQEENNVNPAEVKPMDVVEIDADGLEEEVQKEPESKKGRQSQDEQPVISQAQDPMEKSSKSERVPRKQRVPREQRAPRKPGKRK